MIKKYCNPIGWKHFRTRFLQDMCFLENHKEHFRESFLSKKKKHEWINFLAKVKNSCRGGNLRLFAQN